MRELPEVETVRRDLDKELSGKKVKETEVLSARPVKHHRTKKAFAAAMDGKKISAVRRRGLHLLFELDEDEVLVVHLGESGELRRNANKDDIEDATAVSITFTQGGQLRLIDPGKDAVMFVTTAQELDEAIGPAGDMGLDPVEEPVSWTRFGQLVLSQPSKLKVLLTDPGFIVGLGDLYADEVIFAAGLRPDRLGSSLSTQEVRRLYRGLVQTLHDALKYRGTTSEEIAWHDVHGKPGEYAEYLMVHHREGEVCKRCRATVTKTKVNGRVTYFCESCQV